MGNARYCGRNALPVLTTEHGKGGALACVSLTGIFGETNGQWALADFFLEQIFLIQEQDDWCVREPFVIADRIEQFERLLHSILEINWEEEESSLVGGSCWAIQMAVRPVADKAARKKPTIYKP